VLSKTSLIYDAISAHFTKEFDKTPDIPWSTGLFKCSCNFQIPGQFSKL